MVDEGGNAVPISDKFDCRPQVQSGPEARKLNNHGNQRHPKSRANREADAIYKYMELISCSPIDKVIETNEWLNSDFKYLDKSTKIIQTCINNLKIKYSRMSLFDLNNHFKKCNKVYFSGIVDINAYYYSAEESLDIMLKLLNFQCQSAHAFVYDLYNLIEKLVPKKNTMCVIGPPNCGKSYFFDAVVNLFCNYGQIANFNRYQQFPLMDCVNRRILIWDEPMCETSAYEDLKMLFGGGKMRVKVKYHGDAEIDRTPVIVTANNYIFPNDAAFNSRLTVYNWRQCQYLKDLNKKLNPIAIISLFKHFHIIDNECKIIADNTATSESESE